MSGPVGYAVLVVVLSLVTYRVARFIVLDTMIEGTRDWFEDWLERHPRFLWRKLLEMIGCPFCVTVWVAAGVSVAQRVFVGSFPMPVWTWLAVAALSLTWWAIVDSE